MPLHKAPPKPSPSSSTDDLYEELVKLAPILERVELWARRSRARGRYSRTGVEYVVTTDDERDPETVCQAIVKAAEEVESDHGSPCRFQAVPVVLPPGETAKRLSGILFTLDDEDNGAEGELVSLVRDLTKLNKEQIGMVGRQLSHIEKLTKNVVDMSDAAAKRESASAESVRARLEHERWKVQQENEASMEKEEMHMIESLLGKAITVYGSKDAAKHVQDPEQETWAFARDRAREVLAAATDGSPTADALGEDGVALVEAIATATTQQDAEAPFGKLVTLIRAGEVDGDRLLELHPKLLPLAQFWA